MGYCQGFIFRRKLRCNWRAASCSLIRRPGVSGLRLPVPGAGYVSGVWALLLRCSRWLVGDPMRRGRIWSRLQRARRGRVCTYLHVALFQRMCTGSAVPGRPVKTGFTNCWGAPLGQVGVNVQRPTDAPPTPPCTEGTVVGVCDVTRLPPVRWPFTSWLLHPSGQWLLEIHYPDLLYLVLVSYKTGYCVWFCFQFFMVVNYTAHERYHLNHV